MEDPPDFALWVPFPPRPKERPRMTRRGGVYTPAATLGAERIIAQCWRDACGPYFEGPISVMVEYWADGQEIAIRPATWKSPLKGDIDNMVKLTLDALQGAHNKKEDGVAYKDDTQVVAVQARKMPGRRFPEAQA